MKIFCLNFFCKIIKKYQINTKKGKKSQQPHQNDKKLLWMDASKFLFTIDRAPPLPLKICTIKKNSSNLQLNCKTIFAKKIFYV